MIRVLWSFFVTVPLLRPVVTRDLRSIGGRRRAAPTANRRSNRIHRPNRGSRGHGRSNGVQRQRRASEGFILFFVLRVDDRNSARTLGPVHAELERRRRRQQVRVLEKSQRAWDPAGFEVCVTLSPWGGFLRSRFAFLIFLGSVGSINDHGGSGGYG